MSKSKTISGSTMSIIILLVFIWTLLPSDYSPGRKVFTFDHIKNEGYVAFIVNEYQPESIPDDEDDIQKCDGSGYITHGDGHKTPCPGCENCEKSQSTVQLETLIITDDSKKNSTQNPELTKEAPTDTEDTQDSQNLTVNQVVNGDLEQPRYKQILLFTAYWCGPCQQFKNNEIPKFNLNPKWVVNETKNAHIRIVDIDKKENRPIMDKYKQSRVVPEFVKIINGKFVKSKTGFRTARQISEWYNE